jgi:hypothetical protein
MRKLKLELDRLNVQSFPTVKEPSEPRGTVIAHRPTFCPLTEPLPATYEYYTCDQPTGGACPPVSCG